jgi:hypothetical protein
MADFFAPDKKAPKREAERLRTLAESLMRQGVPSGNEMVSGRIVKKSPIEGLAKALAVGAGGYFSGQAAKAEDEAETDRQQRVAELLSGAGDQRILNVAAIDPSLALKIYADGLTPTSEMKNADWMGITPQQQRAMELNKGYAGTLKEGIAPRVDQFGNVMAAPVQMEGYGDVGSYQAAMAGRQANAQEAAKAGYDMIEVNTPQGPRMMTREQAVGMAQPKGPLSVRNNNPGNMRPVGEGSGFQQFPTPAAGIDAMRNDLLAKVSGGSRAMQGNYGPNYVPTIESVISTWAPPSENDTAKYIQYVSSQTGIDPRQPLTPQDVDRLIPAMIQMEGGKEAGQYFQGDMPGFAVQSGAEQEASKQRAANLAAIDKSRLESLNENAQAIEGQLTTFNQIESLINQGTLGVSPADRLAMAGHKIGIQSPETVNTSTLMKLGNQLVLSRGSLGAGVSVADAERYDKAAGDFSKAQSNEERLQYINTMREIAQKYSDQANSQIQQYRDTGMLPEYQYPVSPTVAGQSIDDEIAKLEAELGIR